MKISRFDDLAGQGARAAKVLLYIGASSEWDTSAGLCGTHSEFSSKGTERGNYKGTEQGTERRSSLWRKGQIL